MTNAGKCSAGCLRGGGNYFGEKCVVIKTMSMEVAIVLVTIAGKCSAVYLRGGTCLGNKCRVVQCSVP